MKSFKNNVEYLLCARCYARVQNTMLNKIDTVSTLMEATQKATVHKNKRNQVEKHILLFWVIINKIINESEC